MTYIPFNESQWLCIEGAYRDNHPTDARKKLPVREVAEWFAAWVILLLPEPFECAFSDPVRR